MKAFLRTFLLVAGTFLFGGIFVVAVMNGPGTEAGQERKRRLDEARKSREDSWVSYRDQNCSLLDAEIRRFSRGAGKTISYDDWPVRVWRCKDGAMFDEVNSQVPKNWRNPLMPAAETTIGSGMP